MKDTPVFFEYMRFYNSGDPDIFRFLYTFLSFGKKMEYDDPEFHAAAFRSWQGVELRLHGLAFDPTHISNLRLVLSTLPKLGSYDFWPKHGPGFVAEPIGRSPIDKHSHIAYDRLLDRAFFTGLLASFGLNEEGGFSPKVLPDPECWDPSVESSRPPSELSFARKNMKTARSVCSEPAKLMYFQQGVFGMMDGATQDSPFGRFIRLRDQSYNRELARFGSFTSSIDTLDLSAASDSLSVDLVRKVFPTDWQIYMLATRSPIVRTSEGLIPLKKFAPMGSAVCFPTQCLVFSAICVYAHCLHTLGWRFPERPKELNLGGLYDVLRRISDAPIDHRRSSLKYQPIGVYGDDICCDYRVTDNVKALLVHFGFEVNEGKSFTGSQSFRESCGGYYLLGDDVTPIFFRIKGIRSTLSAPHVYSQVSLINECLDRNFRNLRSFLIYSLFRWHLPKKIDRLAVPFLYYTSEDFGIKTWSWVRDNSHLKRRYHSGSKDPSKPNYQRTEYRVLSILPDKEQTGDFRHEAYLRVRWWASHRRSVTDLKRVSTHGWPVGYRLGWRWTPVD
jgi:hypothetical protein